MVKDPPANTRDIRDVGSIPGLVRSHGEGNGNPLHYSCLENPMNRGAWWATVHGVAEGRTRLSNFTFTFHFHALEKEMATRSSVLAWRIPGTGKPGGLQSMGSHSQTQLKRLSSSSRRHKRHGFYPWVRKILWRRAWQPTPVFLPGESHWLPPNEYFRA